LGIGTSLNREERMARMKEVRKKGRKEVRKERQEEREEENCLQFLSREHVTLTAAY
jgi:hypothetical protein